MAGIETGARVTVGRVKFVVRSMQEAIDSIFADGGSQGSHFHLANAYCVALAERNPLYRDVLNSGIVLADGKPVSWVSRLRRDSPPLQQVRGPSLFEAALGVGGSRAKPVRHYLLGGSPSSLARLESEIARRFPSAVVCGSASPPFRELADQEVAAQDLAILESNPDVVWVGLGTPKQDYECRRLTESLGVTTVAVGAAFDFTAGTARVAPVWMSRTGFEWLYRLISEPRRLWKRYLFGNIWFLISAIRWWGKR